VSAEDSAPARPATPLNASYDDAPEEYDELRDQGHMARRRVDFFSRVVGRTPGLVTELGCGTGTLLRRLAARFPDRSFLGVEPLPNYVDFATERAAAMGLTNVRFAAATGEELTSVVAPGSVGLLISVDALHHVTDLDRVVRQAFAVTRHDGRWWSMEPNRVHPYVLAYHVLTAGERTFPAREFLRRSRDAGWQLVGRRTMYLYPSGVREVPAVGQRLERRLERSILLAGAVVHDLVKP
jgi:SAM-dependent methyltransferase